MRNILQILRDPFMFETDPVYNCDLYKDKGCSHVDGYLCDFPDCDMNLEYIKNNKT